MNIKKLTLTTEEVVDTFVNTPLEGDYNFLQEDLVKLANAFAEKAKPAIAKQERAECIEFVSSLNHLVASRLEEKRGKM